MAKAASLTDLQELHSLIARSLNQRIAQDMEDGLPTDAATLGPYIHVLDVAGLKGGLNEANEAEICDIVRRNKVSRIKVESNMGHGLFEIDLRAVFNATKDLQHMAQARGINDI